MNRSSDSLLPTAEPDLEPVVGDPSGSDSAALVHELQSPGELLELVYGELRRLAAFKMAREAPGQTLQATALVHEAWLRLAADGNRQFKDRGHFFAVAAETMRRILTDRARRRQRVRHGGGQARVDLDVIEVSEPQSDERVLQVHEALDQLAAEDPLKAQIVKLRFFVGLSDAEVAEACGISLRTVERHWAFAKVWLLQAIRHGGPAQ